MTPQEIIETRFPTVGDIVKDPVFIKKATKHIKNRKMDRITRPSAGEGKKWRRDLLDTFLDRGEEFIPAVANVWGKVSKQSSAVRTWLRAAGDGLFEETVAHYYELEKKKNDDSSN